MFTVTIRNRNFGPIPDSLFMKPQIKMTQQFGIGDGLFVPPRAYGGSGAHQYGLEGNIEVSITAHYYDGSLTTFKNTQFPMLGESRSTQIEVGLKSIKSMDLEIFTPTYGHSRSGGGGMSRLGPSNIGSASIREDRMRSGSLTAEVSLTDRWDESIPYEDLDSGYHELINIKFLTSKKDLMDASWQAHRFDPNWRSQLAEHWCGNPFIYTQSIAMPIGLFSRGQTGWVIPINQPYTDEQSEHVVIWRKFHHDVEAKLKSSKIRGEQAESKVVREESIIEQLALAERTNVLNFSWSESIEKLTRQLAELNPELAQDQTKLEAQKTAILSREGWLFGFEKAKRVDAAIGAAAAAVGGDSSHDELDTAMEKLNVP